MAPVPLIIDTDPGVDDVLAILLALASPAEADVKAITLTFGNTTLDYAYSNVLRVAGVLHSHPELLGRFGAFASDASPILLASGPTSHSADDCSQQPTSTVGTDFRVSTRCRTTPSRLQRHLRIPWSPQTAMRLT